jgi:hypothetical protein
VLHVQFLQNKKRRRIAQASCGFAKVGSVNSSRDFLSACPSGRHLDNCYFAGFALDSAKTPAQKHLHNCIAAIVLGDFA